MIVVYNLKNEDHMSDENDFYIGRGSVLGNPYTHIKDRKTLATFVVGSREEAIELYSDYFDKMYGSNKEFTKEIDDIYERYKTGKTVYLGCFCKPKSCHGDIIKQKLEKRLLKEKITAMRKNKENNGSGEI